MLIDRLEATRAIHDGEFAPYFQPLINLRSGQIAGFEILARWIHPKRGLIPPGEFIFAAEQDGWIDKLMQALLLSAMAATAELAKSVTLSVNISPVQLRDLSLAKTIRSCATRANFALDRLIVEITESALTDNLEHAKIIANELKQLGCRIALDDFGTGYSSLLHLQSLPFDELKVDRSFVSNMTDQRDSRKIVSAVVGLGQSLDLTTVAEGVETEQQAQMLLFMGCELGQGWLFGRPVPASELKQTAELVRASPSTFPHGDIAQNTISSFNSQRLAQLRAVYEGTPVGLAFLDNNCRYVHLNQKLADMNGVPLADHIGRTVAEVLPELYPIVQVYIDRALKGESVARVEYLKPIPPHAELRTVIASYHPARDEANEIVGVSVSLLDVTDETLPRPSSQPETPPLPRPTG